jgi:hypothetical protein
LEEFNVLFFNRKIHQPIVGFLPQLSLKTRREEIEHFILEAKTENYIIIDDDKSLNSLNPEMKNKLVLTDFLIGFSKEKLNESFSILNKII